MWLSDFLAIAAALGLHPAGFLEETLAGELGSGLAGLRLARPLCEPPRILRLVERREDAAQDERREWKIERPYVEELDRRRYREPERVVQLAEEAVDQVEPAALPFLLGVTASAYRTSPVPRLDEAILTLAKAIELARSRGDRLAEADLLQRISFVLTSNGEVLKSLEISALAAAIYLDVGDDAGVGKVMVDRGHFFYYLDRFDDSIAACKASLRYLPEEEERHRFAALQIGGLSYQRQGDLEKAWKYARAAEKLLPGLGLGPFAEGKLAWLLGGISRDLDRLDDAERHLRLVVEIFWRVYPLDAALATVDLVEVQILRGHQAKAMETATRTGELMTPLRENRLARSAITQLIAASRESLTLSAVKEVQRQLDRVRARCQTQAI